MKKRPWNKQRPSNIGRRTGVDVVQGKKIRRQDDGTDVFDDYWTDSDSVHSSETTQSVHSLVKTSGDNILENVSILNENSVSYRSAPRSSIKKTSNQKTGEYEKHNGFRPEHIKKLEISVKNFPEEIGHQTGVDVVQGKRIRRQNDGTDVYENNWTDSDLVHSEIQTMHSPVKNRSEVISENLSVFNRGSMSFMKTPYSSMKKTLNQRSREFKDHDGYFSREQLKNSDASSKKLHFSEDVENSAIARSKMTQTSHLLDETESRPVKNRRLMHENSLESDGSDLSDNINSSVRKSPKMSNFSHISKRRNDLSSSRYDTRAASASLSSKMESGNKTKNSRISRAISLTSHFLNGTNGSPARNGTYTPKTSLSKGTVKINANSIDGKRNSIEKSKVLSATLDVSNRRVVLPSSSDDTVAARASLSSKIESKKKAKNNRRSRIMTDTSHTLDRAEGSSFRNRTYTSKTSYSKETVKSMGDPSDSEINSIERSRRENPALSSDDTVAASNLLSRKGVSRKKTNDKSSRVITQTFPPLIGTENMADSCDTRNVSIEGNSVLLSKTLNLPNNKKKVNKRSSLRSSPRHASKSSEVMNQKENVPSRNGGNANRSEILVSDQRENKLMGKDKQKSSIGRSPIAVKRKIMQTPDALENSLSETSCVENRWEEEIEKNFPGDKSNHTAKSETLNPKQNKSHRGDNSVNRSEILVSCQKENDQVEIHQKSSAERSPRASERSIIQTPELVENRQVCTTADLHKKPTSQNVIQDDASSCKGLRRSSRYRRPPLASWRNERLKFVKASDGKEFKCVGVEDGQPEDDYGVRILAKRFKPKVQKRKVTSWKKRKSIPKTIKKTPILSDKTGKILELYLHRPFSSYEWTLPPNVDAPGYMISRTFKSRFMTFGFLDIAGHSIKDKQHSPQDNLHFVVIKGVVEVVINTTSFTFEKGDSFIVPVGTFYSISNETSSNALLSFSSFRIPFFQYQEKD